MYMHKGAWVSRMQNLFYMLLLAALVATAAGLAVSADLLPAGFSELKSIRHEQGFAYVATIGTTSYSNHEQPSDALLYEGDTLIGPGNSLIDDIRTKGGGRFTVWRDTIYFSAFDNSSPLENNRQYKLKVPWVDSGSLKLAIGVLWTMVALLLPLFSKLPEQAFINMLVALAMLLAYMLLATRFLPEGINSAFVSSAWMWVLVLMICEFVMLVFFACVLKERTFSFSKTLEEFKTQDVILLLLPITPVVQYIILNRDVLDITSSIIIMIFFVALAFASSLIVPWLLSIVGSRTVLMSVGLGLTFVLMDMSALAANFHWHLTGDLTIQSGIFIFTATLLLLLYSLNRKRTYVVVAIFFLCNIAMTIAKVNDQMVIAGVNKDPSKISSTIETTPKIYSYTDGKQMKSTPDIFLLVYDAYSNEETILHHGGDNSEQIKFLKENGFTIYPGIYSLGNDSIGSMSTVLHVTTDMYPKYTSGASAVCHILKSAGYKTMGIFSYDYFFRHFTPSYDENYPAPEKMYRLLIRSVLEGELRFDAGFERISYSDYLWKKRNVFTQEAAKPVFLYTQSQYPGHSQKSGQCLPDETARYMDRMMIANEEMRADLKLLIESRPKAIVVVAGDHGPYLTKDCHTLKGYPITEIDRLDIQDRNGAFLAIRWPQGAYNDRYDIRILQDIFPAVFASLFKDDELFEATRLAHVKAKLRNEVYVRDGIIAGGKDDGKPMFERIK